MVVDVVAIRFDVTRVLVAQTLVCAGYLWVFLGISLDSFG